MASVWLANAGKAAMNAARQRPALTAVAASGLATVAVPGVAVGAVVSGLGFVGFSATGVVGGEIGPFRSSTPRLQVLRTTTKKGLTLTKTLHLCAPGTIAATTQAGIGNVVAQSLFATATSAAAGGYGIATITGAVQAIGGATAAIAAAGAALL